MIVQKIELIRVQWQDSGGVIHHNNKKWSVPNSPTWCRHLTSASNKFSLEWGFQNQWGSKPCLKPIFPDSWLWYFLKNTKSQEKGFGTPINFETPNSRENCFSAARSGLFKVSCIQISGFFGINMVWEIKSAPTWVGTPHGPLHGKF